MPLFPSDEWVGEFCRLMEAHPAAGHMARVLDGDYRFVVEPHGMLAARHVYDVTVEPNGDGAVVAVPQRPPATPRLAITAGYDQWRALIEDRLRLGRAVLLRRVRLSGDWRTLLNRLDDARPLLDALHGVDTVFLEDVGGVGPSGSRGSGR